MMETNPVPETTGKLREINCLNLFSFLRRDPENFCLLGFDALLFVEAMYLPTFRRNLLSLKRPYTSTSLYGVTFQKCNNELLLLTCEHWRRCYWGSAVWAHILVMTLIFLFILCRFLQNTFTKENRKTTSGKGWVQYVMSPSFFLELLACSHG